MTKLTLTTEGDTHVIVKRRFASSPESVYRAHVEPKLVQKWLTGPDGWTMPVCINDARPGGKIRYEWSDGEGGGFYLTGEFIELNPFRRIVHVERMHLPDPTPDNHVETTFEKDGRGTLNDHAHDASQRRDARSHARKRHGARHGGELCPSRDRYIARSLRRVSGPVIERPRSESAAFPHKCPFQTAVSCG